MEEITKLEQEKGNVSFSFEATADWKDPIHFIKDLVTHMIPNCTVKCNGEPMRFFVDIGDDRTATLQRFYITSDKKYLA